ncbi:MAG: LamG-like jellyroll fold domain-containing protein [Pseudomonadota bacterium]
MNGEIYVSEEHLGRVDHLASLIASTDPDYTFTASEAVYGRGRSEISVEEFLREDADSLSGDASQTVFDDVGVTLSGFIYIPPGKHQVTVVSDDGFALSLGGVSFSAFEFGRGAAPTSRTAQFEGGLYQIDLAYFDGGGGQELRLEIDGLPVDQSALYASVADFQNNAGGGEIVPKAQYHPSYFLGEESLGGDDTITGNSYANEIKGEGGDDSLAGRGGNDHIEGGYGDDILRGDNGDDVLDGGRGNDLLIGGDGNDVLISRSDAGEQRIGQLAFGNPTRPDPDNEVNQQRQKLKGYEDQPLEGDDILVGGRGEDTFLITPLLNAKAEIIHKHTRSDGSINWAGVAGENNELHDHWVDAFGIEVIADYKASEDTIAIIGHTASDIRVRHVNVDSDAQLESVITVYSNQHGNGGAHDDDLLGQIVVHGDLVDVDDILTDAGVTWGIIDNISELSEAIAPEGDLKTTNVNGRQVIGYDSRNTSGTEGPIVNRPWQWTDNPYEDSGLFSYAWQSGPQFNDSRYGMQQLGTVEIDGVTLNGTSGNDVLAPSGEAAQSGLPGALGFWRFADAEGTVMDARGEVPATIYKLVDNAPIQQFTPVLTDGPNGEPNGALVLNGEDDFVFINHSLEYEVSQGTVALWVRPDDLSDDAIIVSKDESGTDRGGHFRIGHDDTGRIYIRFAEGNGGSNKAWLSSTAYLEEGEWTHIAVSFTDEGLTVYVDGRAVPDFAWIRQEGNVDNPGIYREAYLTQNTEPWVLGADTANNDRNGTIGEFATDRRDLDDAFTGAITDFGLWGGELTAAERRAMDAAGESSGMDGEVGYALDAAQVLDLVQNGPGTALTAPAGNQAILSGDDLIQGFAGIDSLAGGGGDDTLRGGADADSLEGGYGDDILDGGSGDDALVGGRGSDLLLGGAGNDLLVSRSDAGVQRIGQLAIGQPTREDPDNEVNPERQKLYGWEDQELIADDILVGGEGADTYLFNPQINAKRDIIMEHVREDRSINWAGVAGENNELHDHWIDSFGIDIIADYVADEDTIAIIGHTAAPQVTYRGVDTDQDGTEDEVVSIITVYSNQHGGGGAHDDDLIGQIVVHGDLVDADDLIVNANVTHGIIDTIDDLQEALAPTGELKTTTGPGGAEIIGYDTRTPDSLETSYNGFVTANPHLHSDNPFIGSNLFDTAEMIPDGLPEAKTVFTAAGGSFNGIAQTRSFAHSAALAQEEGTIAMTISPDNLQGIQAFFSKDASGTLFGGQITMNVDSSGRINIRYEVPGETILLQTDKNVIEAEEIYQIVFTFSEDETILYVDGFEEARGEGWPSGMTGNGEPLVLGASASQSASGGSSNLINHFDGYIRNLVIMDRPLVSGEAFLLSEELDMLPGRNEGFETTTARGLPAVVGGVLDNTLSSDNTGEEVLGLFGDDTLNGNGGADTLFGGEGNDTLNGGNFGDTLFGGAGNDRLNGEAGADTLKGGIGNDILFGGAAADMLDGGDGVDWATYIGADHVVWADLQGLVDGIGDGRGDRFVDVENLRGGTKHDQLRGDAGDNVIMGGGAGDRLYGRSGDDVLGGEAGNDVLYGNAGADVMTGGSGNDRYVYFGLADSRPGDGFRDIITDFDQSGADRIEVWRLDADTTRGGNQVFDFVGTAEFSGTAGELRYQRFPGLDETIISADVDGDGAADFEIELTGVVTLQQSDFVL